MEIDMELEEKRVPREWDLKESKVKDMDNPDSSWGGRKATEKTLADIKGKGDIENGQDREWGKERRDSSKDWRNTGVSRRERMMKRKWNLHQHQHLLPLGREEFLPEYYR